MYEWEQKDSNLRRRHCEACLYQLCYAPISDASRPSGNPHATAAVHIVLAPRVRDGLLGVATTAKPRIGSAGFEPATLAVMQLCL